MRALLAAASALIVLGACTGMGRPDVEETPDTSTVTAATGHEKIRFERKRATKAERARCEAAGGVVGPGGMLGYDQCVQPYADAGKACKDAEDCEGRCLLSADSGDDMGHQTEDGICQADDSLFGCYTAVNDGMAEYAICVD